ncbi:MAG: GTPase [Ruminococcus sp.]|nr:GTPase [Ruminococcus sp.]
MPNKQPEEIPVYMFMGFLESGKTKFIKETLSDKRFMTGERTLLLVCEEGIEEYDTSDFEKNNVVMRVLEDKDELNEPNLIRLTVETHAERILVEYNGMWLLNDLFQAMPESWQLCQFMFFADAQTFMQFNANMRSLVVDKLNMCELAVFNRFERSMDPQEYHQIVRGVSRRTDICYEYTDGEIAYDDIEDPLPFDVEADHIVIEDKDFALWYRDIMEEPGKYDGKTVTFKGLAARNRKFPENTFAIGRHIMTCCVEDIQYCWCVAQYGKAFEPRPKHWVNITARIKVQRHKLYKGAGPVLFVTSLEDTQPPEKEVATFY